MQNKIKNLSLYVSSRDTSSDDVVFTRSSKGLATHNQVCL